MNRLLKIFFSFIFLLGLNTLVAQNKEQPILISKDSIPNYVPFVYNPNAPAKAAFYSAVLPGLGQAYNKKYWKIPIVYAGLGAGMYFVVDNNKQYKEYRDEYKKRLNGTNDPNHPLYGPVSDKRLVDAQKYAQRNRDLSIVITALIYIVNIVDANVDAHLMQFNVDDNLSFKPQYKLNEYDNKHNVGLSLNYKFN